MIGRLKTQIERNQRVETHAARYDSGQQDVKVRTLRRFLHDLSGQDVLDAGCGTGDVASMCSSQRARVTALDLYEPMLRKARSAAGVTLRRPFDNRLRQHAAFLGPREVAKTGGPKEAPTPRASTQLRAAFPCRDAKTNGAKRRIAAHQVRHVPRRCLSSINRKASRDGWARPSAPAQVGHALYEFTKQAA